VYQKNLMLGWSFDGEWKVDNTLCISDFYIVVISITQDMIELASKSLTSGEL